MKYTRVLSALALLSFGLFITPESQRSFACSGSSGSVCIVTTNPCLKSMVLSKSSPGVVLLPSGMSVNFNLPMNLFIIANNPGPGCPACPSPANPTSARIDLSLSPLLGGPVVAMATISTNNGTMTLPGASAAGTFNSYSVPVTVPAGTATGAYRVVGRAIVNFSDGLSINQTGDTVVCLVEPAPNNASVPRLDMQLLTPSIVRMAAGDQHAIMYRITNNDPVNSVMLTAFANSKQNAVRPQGANETRGVFAIANLFGDDFPIFFGTGVCIPFPAHPYTQPELMQPLPPIPPNSSVDVPVRIRSYGMCASGSCSESTLRVEGTFSDSSPAFACAGMAHFVDTSVPTTVCLPRSDDCNNNGIPDWLDIANGTCQDTNFNAVCDDCETGNAPIIPNVVQVTPNSVPVGGQIQVSVTALPDFGQPTTNVITDVWANGVPLSSGDGTHWMGTIPADTRPGPQTVYALAKENNGAVATHIGPYTTFGTQTCPLTTLPNDGSTSANARAPSTRFRFERSVYLITAAELAAAGYTPGTLPMSIGWNYQTAPGVPGAAPLTIYLQNTNDTTNTKSTTWAQAIAGMTVVHNAVTNLPGTAGPFDIPFQGGAPFMYTGGGLYVAFDWNNYPGTLSTTAVVFCNVALTNGLLGAQSNASPPATIAPSNFRPETRLSSSTQNDAAVNVLYSYGELPLGLVPPQAIKAVVSDRGVLSQTNLPVALSVTGADTFSDNQTIASLAPCNGQAMVSFAPFTPNTLGSDSVQVSVPADDVGTNNVLTKPLAITQLSYSYKYPGSTATGGVGLTGATGAFVGKFTTATANAVTDVKLEFSATSATTYRVAIYPDSGNGTPSTNPLYVDAADRTVSAPGPITITLPNPVALGPGNFFVGIQQTNTTNAALSFDAETPIRSGSFYFASPNPPTAWTDFSPGNNFKLNIGLLLQNPFVPVTLTQAVSRKTHTGVGDFDVVLPPSGPPGIECRTTTATNDYAIRATFSTNVTVNGNPQAELTQGVGCVGQVGVCTGQVTVVNNVVIIPLTNIANAQTLRVRLNQVNSTGADTPATDFTIPMSVLIGDTNANATVNAADVAQTKARLGQTVDATNFRSDVNANGSINAADTAIVKQHSGTSLPP